MVSYDGLDKVIGAKLALAIVKPIVFALVYVRRARAADVDVQLFLSFPPHPQNPTNHG